MVNIFKNLVFNKVKEALGLTMCKYFMTGAAPISDLTLDFFASLDIPTMNLYGDLKQLDQSLLMFRIDLKCI